MQPAIDRWEALLRHGFDITAVSGSDSKGVESEPERRGYGSSATAVYADELSRPALIEALRDGHAYVRARGARAARRSSSPAVAADGAAGDDRRHPRRRRAELTVTIRGGSGQTLTILRDGEPVGLPVPITSDPFTHTWTADRDGASGPLGTFWRVDVADAQALTVITNPIFLDGEGEPVPGTTRSRPPGRHRRRRRSSSPPPSSAPL